MTRVYYKEAVGAFVVFDATRASTFEAVQKWKNDLDSKVSLPDGSPVPCVLLGNKVSFLIISPDVFWDKEIKRNKFSTLDIIYSIIYAYCIIPNLTCLMTTMFQHALGHNASCYMLTNHIKIAVFPSGDIYASI